MNRGARAMASAYTFYIWSNEHSAWWAHREQGYTTNRREAGWYAYEDAVRICHKANRWQLSTEPPNECMVPIWGVTEESQP
jgi:hypothetical protein